MPFRPNSFDVVTAGNAFHWFANGNSIKNIKKVLKRDGLFFIYWKEIDKKDVLLRREIFRPFTPTYRSVKNPIQFKDFMKLFHNHGFKKLGHINKKYTEEYTLDKAIGRLRTIGGYFRLTSKQKKDFEVAAKKIFEDYIKRKKSIKFSSIIHICYGFKKYS